MTRCFFFFFFSDKREKSYECFLDDLKRCEVLGLKLYNFQYVSVSFFFLLAFQKADRSRAFLKPRLYGWCNDDRKFHRFHCGMYQSSAQSNYFCNNSFRKHGNSPLSFCPASLILVDKRQEGEMSSAPGFPS